MGNLRIHNVEPSTKDLPAPSRGGAAQKGSLYQENTCISGRGGHQTIRDGPLSRRLPSHGIHRQKPKPVSGEIVLFCFVDETKWAFTGRRSRHSWRASPQNTAVYYVLREQIAGYHKCFLEMKNIIS